MRTNVVLNDDLINQAIKLGHFKTKKAAIEEGLRLLVQMQSQSALRKMRGKIKWEGDLEEMRKDRNDPN